MFSIPLAIRQRRFTASMAVVMAALMTVTATPLPATGHLPTGPIAEQAGSAPRAALAPDVDDGWELVFSDEFDGEELDRSKWNTCWHFGCTNAANPQISSAVDRNLALYDGALHLSTVREKYSDGYTNFDWTSAMVSTGPRSKDEPPLFTYTYGYAEARVRMPAGSGVYSAFWTVPAKINYWPPEHDIFERLGDDPDRLHMTQHWPAFEGAPRGNKTYDALPLRILDIAESTYYAPGRSRPSNPATGTWSTWA